MNIIEAVKSGRPFTRSGWQDYLRVVSDSIYNASADPRTASPHYLTAEDLIAEDWFLEPLPKPRKVKKTGWVWKPYINGQLPYGATESDGIVQVEYEVEE